MAVIRIFVKGMEYVVSRPLLATITVGGSILLLLAAVGRLAEAYPSVGYLRLLVPFLPPFVITRTARRINRRIAEFDFIRDAEAVLLVGFPRSDRLEDLLETRPRAFSDSAVRHLNALSEELASQSLLAPPLFSPGSSERLFRRLLERRPDSQGRRAISGYAIEAPGKEGEPVRRFFLAAALRPSASGWKLQLTLLPDREGEFGP